MIGKGDVWSRTDLRDSRFLPGSSGLNPPGVCAVTEKFEIGDHVSWNSEAGRVSGTIVAIHTRDFDYEGHIHRASKDDPQYEIKSDKTDHIAAHKGRVLSRIR
jgi:hypothetical protein